MGWGSGPTVGKATSGALGEHTTGGLPNPMRSTPCGSLWPMRRLTRAVGSEAGDILTA
jgi:hypothetical protein